MSNSIQDAINNLSSKKHVVSYDAIQAKTNQQSDMDSRKKVNLSTLNKQTQLLEEFGYSVEQLKKIFQQSHLDELLLLMGYPARLFTLNFFIGIFRGVGFIIGVLIILLLIFTVFKESIFSILNSVPEFINLIK